MKSSKVKSEEIDKSSKDVKYEEEKTLQEEYINSLSEVERSTMRIAEEHLKTSFSLRKSIGYMKWLANKK